MAFAFEKLLVYQKAIPFADAVCTLTRELPRGYFFLGDQLSRASLSIAANIAEGNGRFTKAERRNSFGIARGSIQECVPLLELAARRGFLKPEFHSGLNGDLEEIARLLSGLINGLERRQSRGTQSSNLTPAGLRIRQHSTMYSPNSLDFRTSTAAT
jgi:four helix bundle protein